MIPTIKLTVPVPYENEYAESPISISPSYTRGIREMETDVDLGFAAFLIDEGELDMHTYISEVIEQGDYGNLEDEEWEKVYNDINEELLQAVNANRKTWEDFV